MHRSGTSLTASILGSSGLHLGRRLAPAARGNAEGHFEDLEFVHLHRAALQVKGFHPDGWDEVVFDEIPDVLEAKARALVEARSSRPLWGWKDPRTTLFLPFWERLLPEARFVFVYRNPWEVVDSLYRRGDDRLRDDPAASARLWSHYNRLILDALCRLRERAALFDLDDIAADPSGFVEHVSRAFGLQLRPPREVFKPALLRRDASRADWRARSEVVLSRQMEVLRRLDAETQRLGARSRASAGAGAPAAAKGTRRYLRVPRAAERARGANRAPDTPRPMDARLQLFVPVQGRYPESASLVEFLDGQTRGYSFLVRYEASAPLRLDPGESVGIIELEALSVRARDTGLTMSWSGSSLETAPLRLVNAIRLSRRQDAAFCFLSLNRDPQVYVDPPGRERFQGTCQLDVTIGVRPLAEDPAPQAAAILLRELDHATGANSLLRAQLADAGARQDAARSPELDRLQEALARSERLIGEISRAVQTLRQNRACRLGRLLALWRRVRSAAGGLRRRLAPSSAVSSSDLHCLERTPLFDPDFYLATNPDVRAARLEPRRHYLSHGAAEGRDPSPWFNTGFYLARYPDVAAAGVNALVHYVKHGAREGRLPNPRFDLNRRP